LSKKGNYSATEMPNTGHRGQMSAEPMSELNSDVTDEERSGVCQTKVSIKKKKNQRRMFCTGGINVNTFII